MSSVERVFVKRRYDVLMLRDPALIPLSRQHQHALALCVRIDRALGSGNADLPSLQSEVARLFEQEIRYHFDAEECVLFPAAEKLPELRELVLDLGREHVVLRAAAARAAQREMTRSDLEAFAAQLSEHIRREERELFEAMQKQFSPEELFRLGAAVDADFRTSCLPGASCEIRPRR